MQTIGSRLRWARETAGVTTRDIATAAGVAIGYTTAVELGRVKKPGAETLLKLARVLGVDFEWLADGTEPAPSERKLRQVGRALKQQGAA